MTQPVHPELNPFDMEHRVTIQEQAQLRTTEALGNMANSVEKLSQTISRMEQQRVAEMATVHSSIDDIVAGIAQRRQMDTDLAAEYSRGRESVKFELPWKQVITITGGIGVIVATVTGIITLAIQLN